MEFHNFYTQVKNTLSHNITLVVVSKNQSINKIKQIYKLGHKIFGENRVQELLNKKNHLPIDINWHFIGHLQSNKIKYILPFIVLIHSVDCLNIMNKIQIEAKKINQKVSVLLQLKIAIEKSKYGLNQEEFYHIISLYEQGYFSNIIIKGVMGMASFTENQYQIKNEFLLLKSYFDFLKLRVPLIDILSMGMSKDYKIAITCGSTMVRIGTNIFL